MSAVSLNYFGGWSQTQRSVRACISMAGYSEQGVQVKLGRLNAYVKAPIPPAKRTTVDCEHEGALGLL